MRQSLLYYFLYLWVVAEGIDLSSKRGLAFHGDDHESDNNLLTSNNSIIAWYYTWSLWPSQQIGNSLPFIPLIHGLDDASDAELQKRLNSLPDSSTHLLTFNEPDGETDTGGSAISPKDAAKAYMENIVPLRDAKREWSISHPSVTGSPRGLDWLRDFNESCYDIDDKGCPTDFIAVHCLRDFYNETAPDAPFWITEMALPQEDEEATFAMMNETLPNLDSRDDVEAYAWFGAFRTNDANEWTGKSVSLFDSHGGLTKLGAEYLGGEEKGFEEGMSEGALRAPSRCLLGVAMFAAAIYLW
ncbi:serine-rich protein [Fusarium langsethiae]|uniref:Serine-rich protein n=1 Tax=Fusarium langsethiae TaxID=179993 RepID=A0A0N0V5F2_FUSLA|nr:serine-rich protein [Fusarium langsethiae]